MPRRGANRNRDRAGWRREAGAEAARRDDALAVRRGGGGVGVSGMAAGAAAAAPAVRRSLGPLRCGAGRGSGRLPAPQPAWAGAQTFVSPAGPRGRWPLPAPGVSLRLCGTGRVPGDINKPVIERIIRVDHAGEYGANRIYAGQMAVLGRSSVGPVIQVSAGRCVSVHSCGAVRSQLSLAGCGPSFSEHLTTWVYKEWWDDLGRESPMLQSLWDCHQDFYFANVFMLPVYSYPHLPLFIPSSL